MKKQAAVAVSERAGGQPPLASFAVKGFNLPRIVVEAFCEAEAKRIYKEHFSLSVTRPDDLILCERTEA